MWWKTEEVSTTHRTAIPSFPLYRLANSNPMNRLSKSNTGAHDRIADADRRSNTQTHGIRKGKFLVPLNWPWVTLTLKLSTNFENSHCTRGLGISDQSCLYACRMGVGIVVQFENRECPGTLGSAEYRRLFTKRTLGFREWSELNLLSIPRWHHRSSDWVNPPSEDGLRVFA